MKKRSRITHNTRPTGFPARAGTPWSAKEDRQLWQEHQQGLTIAQMADAHLRTKVGIEARLEVLNVRAQSAVLDRTVSEIEAAVQVADAFKQPELVIDALAAAGGKGKP